MAGRPIALGAPPPESAAPFLAQVQAAPLDRMSIFDRVVLLFERTLSLLLFLAIVAIVVAVVASELSLAANAYVLHLTSIDVRADLATFVTFVQRLAQQRNG